MKSRYQIIAGLSHKEALLFTGMGGLLAVGRLARMRRVECELERRRLFGRPRYLRRERPVVLAGPAGIAVRSAESRRIAHEIRTTGSLAPLEDGTQVESQKAGGQQQN